MIQVFSLLRPWEAKGSTREGWGAPVTTNRKDTTQMTMARMKNGFGRADFSFPRFWAWGAAGVGAVPLASLAKPAAPPRDLFFVGSSMAPPRSFVLGAFSVPSCVLASPATSHRNRRFTRRTRLSPGNRRASALRRHSVFLHDRDPWLGHRCLNERLSEVPLHQLRSAAPWFAGA